MSEKVYSFILTIFFDQEPKSLSFEEFLEKCYIEYDRVEYLGKDDQKFLKNYENKISKLFYKLCEYDNYCGEKKGIKQRLKGQEKKRYNICSRYNNYIEVTLVKSFSYELDFQIDFHRGVTMLKTTKEIAEISYSIESIISKEVESRMSKLVAKNLEKKAELDKYKKENNNLKRLIAEKEKIIVENAQLNSELKKTLTNMLSNFE